MKKGLAAAALALLICALSTASYAGKTKVIEKSFDRVESLRIETVLGGCVIEKGTGSGIEIRLEYSYDEGQFEARFKERDGTLYIEEDLEGENVRGESDWHIVVPAGIDIRFESATGSLKATGLSGELEARSGTGEIMIYGFNGDLEAHSGTGEIILSGSEGEFDLNSGTGDVIVNDSRGNVEASSGTGNVSIDKAKGDFEVSSGTGSVEAAGLSLEDHGEFSSGTGDAEVSLPEGGDYELEISSGTGKAVLECNGAGLDAYVEMSAKKRSGRITSSYDFDEEEEYYRGEDKYVRKSLTKGSGARKIEIRTGTGTAKLKK